MGYLALYNKYRPNSFDEVVGQEVIVKTLKNALEENMVAHAYLFCGPRGTGKTTMARLFAKALNCEKGVGKQCLECDSCKAIAKGTHPDVYEIDAASNSSVLDVRKLIDNVAYQPLSGRYKIYIIDEVHNMSSEAFNALLKTLEEPPSFVIFILATTEPQKILPTILSRVQRYDFSKVSKEDLVKNMVRVLKGEKMEYEDDAILEIADISDGGVRDSLSLLDQAVSYSGGKVTLECINTLFGLVSKTEKLKMIKNIADNKSDEVILSLRENYQKGIDLLRFHKDILNILKDIYIYKVTSDEKLLSKVNRQDIVDINILPQRLKYLIDVLVDGYKQYKYSDDLLSNCELTFLSLFVEETVKEEKVVIHKEVEVKKNDTPIVTKDIVTKEDRYVTKPVLVEVKKEEKEIVQKVSSDDVIKFDQKEILNLMQRATKQDRINIESKWKELANVDDVELKKVAKALSLMNLRLVDKQDLIILASSQFDAQVDMLLKKDNQEKLITLAEKLFNEKFHILVIADEVYSKACTEFKKGNLEPSRTPQIDFGNESIDPSDEFVKSLFSE